MDMKVCFTTIEFPPDSGGVSKSSGRICRFLRESGCEVHVFAPSPGEPIPADEVTPYEVDGIYVHRVPIGNSQFKQTHYLDDFAEVISRVDKRVDFDIFHGFFLHMGYPCVQVAGDRPLVASVRGMDAGLSFELPYKEHVIPVLQKANWVTSVSSDSLRQLSSLVDISGRSGFVPNSIDASSVDGSWSVTDANRGRVGTVCTFRPKKNIPLLIEAYSTIPAGLRSELLLVGDFINERVYDHAGRQHCLDIIEHHSLQSQVTFTGLIENHNLHDYYRRMNVFVISSNHEGLPNTLLEAASHGVPIVSTAVDGMKDAIDDGVNGLLVPPQDAAAMGNAISSILSDSALAEKLSIGAVELAQNWSFEYEKNQWVEIYTRARDAVRP